MDQYSPLQNIQTIWICYLISAEELLDNTMPSIIVSMDGVDSLENVENAENLE